MFALSYRASLNRVLRIRLVLATLMLAIGLPAHAATWELDQSKSRVIFKYSFEGKPYQGEFKNVKATFDIDPLKPAACKFTVTIPIKDLSVASAEVKDYLHDVELFDVDQFPTASFKADKCSLKSVNSFVADGTLTIRDKTHPLSFPFKLDIEMAGAQPRFHLTSEVTIQRLKFGVGQGYWANTSGVPNDVVIAVDVYAVSKK
ncbi:MAG: YceI family protein [Candidatus Obscuribacterales bacterium]|nr:YceI family protein [Steroidobacteraceae bacterium]